MKIKIRSFAFIREQLGSKQVELNVNATKVKEIIHQLISQYPTLEDILVKNGEINKDFVFAVNGDQIPHTELKEKELKEGDTLVILPPAGGG